MTSACDDAYQTISNALTANFGWPLAIVIRAAIGPTPRPNRSLKIKESKVVPFLGSAKTLSVNPYEFMIFCSSESSQKHSSGECCEPVGQLNFVRVDHHCMESQHCWVFRWGPLNHCNRYDHRIQMLQNAAFEYGHFAGFSSKQFKNTQIDPGHFDTLAKICEKTRPQVGTRKSKA